MIDQRARRPPGQPARTAARQLGRVITSRPAPRSIRPRPRRAFFSLAEPVRARLVGPVGAPEAAAPPAADPEPAAEPAAAAAGSQLPPDARPDVPPPEARRVPEPH